MWPLTRHNDAAEIVASLLILSAIRGGRKIFFSLLIRLRWKISLIKLRRSPITTPQHAEKVLHIHWIIWRSSAIILLILCTQCTATSAGGAKLTRFDRSLKQGNSFHDMPPLPRIIQQCAQSYIFQVLLKLLLLGTTPMTGIEPSRLWCLPLLWTIWQSGLLLNIMTSYCHAHSYKSCLFGWAD